MHQKYGKDGLVVVSVSLDLAIADAEDKVNPEEVRKTVSAFLQKRNAGFGALILDEPNKLLQEKLHFVAAPCAFVFNRRGQWTQFAGDRNEFDEQKIESFVEQALKEK
jgi:hypothetical protein